MTREEAQKMVDTINTMGGRRVEVVKLVECENEDCYHQLFCSQPQDVSMRNANGEKHICPECRRKLQREKRRLKNKKIV